MSPISSTAAGPKPGRIPNTAPASLRFATAVAGFAEILRQSPHARGWSLASVERIADAAAAGSPERLELVQLAHRARNLSGEGKLAVAQ